MPFTEEDKILINNLFGLKDLNGKHLIRVSQQKLERRPCLLLWVTGWVNHCSAL